MRFIMLSDVHGFFNIDIPDGDVLIFAGDTLAGRGTLISLSKFNKWLGELPHKHKIVIAGNHDFVFDTHKHLCKAILSNAVYLEHEPYYIIGHDYNPVKDDYNRIKLFASPYHPKVWGKFELEREDLHAVWDTVPDDVDILITHGPPMGIMDWTEMGAKGHEGGGHVGDQALLEAVLRIEPMVHIFGHIHEGYGHSRIGKTHFFNVSICDVEYNPVNKPTIWDY